MFRVLEINSTGMANVAEGSDRVAPPPPGVTRWVDLEAQDEAQLALLGERFGFHPLALEDCSHFDQRPKLEQYSDYLFIVTHGFQFSERDELQALELHTFLGERYLVTIHSEPFSPLEDVWRRLQAQGSAARHGTDFLCYLVADAIVDTMFPLVDHVAEEAETVQEALLGHASHEGMLENILRLQQLLVMLRKVLAPQRDVLALLAKRGDGRIAERTALYFRDVYDHLLRINQSVEATRDLLTSVLDAYLWTASQRTNEIMKRLTILSAIFLPLSFITGFFGQNFEAMPFSSNWLLAAMLVSCAVVPAGMLYFFLRSKWF